MGVWWETALRNRQYTSLYPVTINLHCCRLTIPRNMDFSGCLPTVGTTRGARGVAILKWCWSANWGPKPKARMGGVEVNVRSSRPSQRPAESHDRGSERAVWKDLCSPIDKNTLKSVTNVSTLVSNFTAITHVFRVNRRH